MPDNKPQGSSNLDKIIEDTKKDTIDWIRENPTTYVWTPTARVKVIVQRVQKTLWWDQQGRPGVRTIKQYVFQVVEDSVQKLLLNGADEKQVNEKLETLYNTITDSITRKGLDFLKSIPPG